ncbi:MAG: hypothetical protein ACREDO_12565 [Methyloceanibacter sp.]
MFGSMMPSSGLLDWHPVHRANALLRSAWQSAGVPSPEALQALLGPRHLQPIDDAITRVIDGLAGSRYSDQLAARLRALSTYESLAPGYEAKAGAEPLLAAEEPERSEEIARLESSVAIESADTAFFGVAPRAQLQTLVTDFYRRQQQVSLFVLGSVAAAIGLTLLILLLVAVFAPSEPAEADEPAPERITTVEWQRPQTSPAAAGLQTALIRFHARTAPVVVGATFGGRTLRASDVPPSAQMIQAMAGRKLALAPHLPTSDARYFLLRGLPAGATLSAGQETGTGAWMVRRDEVADLTLNVGAAASGEYPLEVYLLDAGNTPEPRRSLVLRIEGPRPYASGLARGLTSALADLPFTAAFASETNAEANPAILFERGKRLLDEGDIAAARLIFQHLAEHGNGAAAYELARTFDQGVLAGSRVKGMTGDAARARAWYERAKLNGFAEATERLRILASLSRRTSARRSRSRSSSEGLAIGGSKRLRPTLRRRDGA